MGGTLHRITCGFPLARLNLAEISLARFYPESAVEPVAKINGHLQMSKTQVMKVTIAHCTIASRRIAALLPEHSP
jgi:hypothetical protein